MFYNSFKYFIFICVFVIYILPLCKNNCTKINGYILFDFIAKIKIKGNGVQTIICPEILNLDNQKYPDEIFIEKDNTIIENIPGGTYKITLEENENLIIIKWYTYPNSTRRMFKNCVNITEIDLTQFNLTSIVNMGNMFLKCINLANIKFGNYPTSSLYSTYGTFSECEKLTSLDLSMFDTSNVETMGYMFSKCYSLTSLNISNFKTGKVKTFFMMFSECQNIETLDLSNFNTSSLKNISYMFDNCRKLSKINLSSFDTSKIKDMSYLFSSCSSLISLDISNFKTSQVVDMRNMFDSAYSLKFLNISNFDTNNVINMEYMFNNCNSLENLDVSNFKVEKILNMEYMFKGCSSLVKLDLSNWNAMNNIRLNSFLEGCFSLKSVNFTNFNTENVVYMQNMFTGCSNLTYLDLSHFNTAKIENITEIFRNCKNLEFLNLSNWDNSRIVTMHTLFYNCQSLKEIDLSNFNTFNVKQIQWMFYKCYSLVSLDLSSFDTSKVTNMGHMFYGCKSLKSLNVSHFNTSTVEYFDNMFVGCSSLISLDISSFVTKNGKNFENMLKGCTNLSYINMSNFVEYNSDENIYNNFFNKVKNNLKICIQKNKTPIITKLVDEIVCATIYCKKDWFRINKKFDIYGNKCKTVCPEDLPFEMISSEKCYNYCRIDFILKEKCKLNFEENKDNMNNKEIKSTKAQDIMLRNVGISFTSKEYNTSNLDNGKEEIIKDEIMQIALTTTKIQRYNYYYNNNMTAINLGDCETLLRAENNISEEELLYMRKIDVYQKGMRIPKIEFDIYYKENNTKLKKLNLSICENSMIYLLYFVDISETSDIYNPKSDYYNNICYPATSNRGTDITLTDRQIEFVEGNKTLCQDGCVLEKYDNINKNSKCSCKGKEFKSIIDSIADIKINKKKLFENFIDVDNIVNIQIIKCYKVLFSKEGIINNIAFYLIIPILIFHI